MESAYLNTIRHTDHGLMCVTHVAQDMSTDTGGTGDGDRMEKIDVRVPAAVLEAIDEEYERRGYASRSEAIRDALRDWLNPSIELSDDVLEDLAVSREQRERGETRSLEDVMDKYDTDGGDDTIP